MFSKKTKQNMFFITLIIILTLTTAMGLYLLNSDSSRSQQPVSAEPNKTLSPPPAVAPEIVEKQVPKPLSNRIVEYHITVELDAANKKLTGVQTLTWTNPGKLPVDELYFHLYPNAFRSEKTTFMKESGGKLRNDKMKEDSFGGMDLHSIKTVDGEELISRMKFVQPDDGNENDQTLMKIRLPEPVLPHKDITLNMSFAVQLPQVFARMGYSGDFVMAGQWFPKISVYENAGVRGRTSPGWNLHQYHGNSEFYSDFGIYNVLIKVPANYIVAATGFPTNSAVIKGAQKTYHFYADDVHDFAWAASPNFVYAEEPYSDRNVPGVKIKLYLDPKHKDLKERYFQAAKKSLSNYSKWYGSYPYSTLSIVVPPEGGNGAGGMEYPTLVTGWEAKDDHPDLELERVLGHEIGHQYWYGMVASNEFEEAWLDEGLTSYTESKFMETQYDVPPNFPVESSYMTHPAALKLAAWDYTDHNQYAENVYIRAKLVLAAIEKQIGTKQMNRVMKAYFEKWKFKHPATKDFQRVLESITHQQWDTFFNQFVYGGNMVDYAVEGIQTQEMNTQGRKTYESIVHIKKKAGSYATVPIHFHFADGTETTKKWAGTAAEIQYKITSNAPLQWAAIDPGYSLVLENKHINNFLKTTVDDKLTVRLNLALSKIIEACISWIAW